MNEQRILLELLRVAVCGAAVTEELKTACTEEMLEKVYDFSIRHDLTHLVGEGVSKLSLPAGSVVARCTQASMQGVVRYLRQASVFSKACQVLEEAKIPFIPLKGSVLRNYYPQEWMRNSCDIDILVQVENLERAKTLLADKLKAEVRGQSDHDISMYTCEGVHLELHYDTIQERYEVGGCRDVLAKIWEEAKPQSPESCLYVLPDALFYFYHMAHMAKHFTVGGCGIRAYLDIWVMENFVPHSKEERDTLLQEGGLLKFARGSQALSRYWFDGETPQDVTLALSAFILRARLYGNQANRTALGQAKMGGKVRYLMLRRVFMPYDYLKAEYPILQKHKWLTPAYQVVRWGRMLFTGGWKSASGELKAAAKSTDKDTADAQLLLEYLGL